VVEWFGIWGVGEFFVAVGNYELGNQNEESMRKFFDRITR